MDGKTVKSQAVSKLRRRAEEIVKEQGDLLLKDQSALSHQEALRLVHELRVHQVELQMQNDELSRAQVELNAARERYFDLYNLAPVGYFIVSHEGRILETNLAGTNLLGTPRAALVQQPITRFILKEDQDVYYFHRRQLLATGQAHTCEVRMVKTDGTAFWVRLVATPRDTRSESGNLRLSRVVLSDISEQKQLEQARATADRHVSQAQGQSVTAAQRGRSEPGKKAKKDGQGRRGRHPRP